MNEATFQSFLESRLRRAFKDIVLHSIREVFFKKFTEITNQYENGELIIDGNHSLNALVKAFDDINYKDVNDAIITDVKTKIRTDYGIDRKVVELDFNFRLKINGISGFVSNVCRDVIKNRDLFGVTDRTFVKNRDRVDREEIVGLLNRRLRDKCDKIQLDDGSVKDIDEQIKENVERMMRNTLSYAKELEEPEFVGLSNSTLRDIVKSLNSTLRDQCNQIQHDDGFEKYKNYMQDLVAKILMNILTMGIATTNPVGFSDAKKMYDKGEISDADLNELTPPLIGIK